MVSTKLERFAVLRLSGPVEILISDYDSKHNLRVSWSEYALE